MNAMNTTSLEKAVDLAATAHRDQMYGDAPYIEHCRRVAEKATGQWNHPDVPIVAWLHDTVEDADVTISDIEREFGRSVADAVETITRRKSETYRDFIKRVATNPVACCVKIADLEVNLEACRVNPKGNLVRRYEWALSYLKTVKS